MAILCYIRKYERIDKDQGDEMKSNHKNNNRRTHEQQIWCKDKGDGSTIPSSDVPSKVTQTHLTPCNISYEICTVDKFICHIRLRYFPLVRYYFTPNPDGKKSRVSHVRVLFLFSLCFHPIFLKARTRIN